jgi:ARC6-like, IMS domain
LEFGAIGTTAAIGGAAALTGTVAANLANHPPEAVVGVPPAHRDGRRRTRKVEGVAGTEMPIAPAEPAAGTIGVHGAAPTNGRVVRRPGEPKKPAWFLPAVLSLILLVGYALTRCGSPNSQAPQTAASNGLPISDELMISLDQPLIGLPGDPSEGAAGIQGDMNPATAKQLLELWFSAKKAAMGTTHAVDQLNAVLTGDKLQEWREEAIGAKEENLSIAYEHGVEVTNVEVSKENPNEAKVTANIREQRKYTKDGQPLEDQTDDLPLTYTFVRENNQWKIKSW